MVGKENSARQIVGSYLKIIGQGGEGTGNGYSLYLRSLNSLTVGKKI